MNGNITVTNEKRRKIGKKAATIIGVFVAAAAMTISATAYVIRTNMEIYADYAAGGDTSEFAEQLEASVKEAENDDIKLTINGLAADNTDCRMLVSVEAKTRKGRDIIHDLQNPDKEKFPYFNQIMIAQTDDSVSNNSLDQIDAFSYNFPDRNDENTFRQMYMLDMTKIDTTKPFKLIEQESGVAIEFDITAYIESYRVYADKDDKSVCHHVELTPLGIHILTTTEDISGSSMYYYYFGDSKDNPEVYVNYADGSQKKLEGHSAAVDDEVLTEKDGETFTNTKINFYDEIEAADGNYIPSFINAKDAVSVTINGVEYKKR